MKKIFLCVTLCYAIMTALCANLTAQDEWNSGFPGKIQIRTYDTVIPVTGTDGAYLQCGAVADMNNDGFDDIILQEISNGNEKLHILYGGSQFPDAIDIHDSGPKTVSITLENFSFYGVQCGDLQGDGSRDMVIMGYETEGISTGTAHTKLYVIGGDMISPGAMTVTASDRDRLMQIYGKSSIPLNSAFMVSDMDGDGRDDVMLNLSIVNPELLSPMRYIQAVFTVYGKKEMPLDLNVETVVYPITRVLYDTSYSNFYFHSFSAGDLDNDNKKEILMQAGIHHSFTGYPGVIRDASIFRGTTHLYYGVLIGKPDDAPQFLDVRNRRNGIADFITNTKKIYSIVNPVNYLYIEANLAAHDLNGDGYDDAIISYYRSIENEVELSHTYVLFGSGSVYSGGNLDDMADGVLNIYGQSGDGSQIVSGDVNGDGYGDCIIGNSQDWFYILYGRKSFPGSIDFDSDTALVTAVSGAELAGCGDINGDGYDDIIAHAPQKVYILFGRGKTYSPGEEVARNLPPNAESRHTYSFSDGSSFRFHFITGRPSQDTQIRLTNFGRQLPDSLNGIPAGNGAGVISFMQAELTDMPNSFRTGCSFGYSDSLITALGIQEEDLSVSWWDEENSQWTKVERTVDTERNLVTFSTDHFSLWALVDINDPIVASVGERQAAIPARFALNRNYPNPFNPVTTISFDLPRRSDVHIEIFNLLGQRVAALAEESLPAGMHARIWDASGFGSGIYFVRMKAEGYSQTMKITLLK